MKRIFILFSLIILWSVTASAALDPIRITIANAGIQSNKVLKVDVLSVDGTTVVANIPQRTVSTDASGVLSFVLNDAEWTGCTYDENYLVKIVYNGIVLKLERLKVVAEKQGLFGVKIDPNEINATSTNGYVLKTDGVNASWALETDPAVKAINGLVKGDGYNITAAVAGTDYIVPYGSTTKNYVLASPDGSAGVPTFRALVDDDVPAILTLDGSTINNSIIGGTTPAAGTFSSVALKTGSYKTSFTAGTQTADVAYVLPTADGTDGQVLKTNGAGALSWTNLTNGGTVTSVSVATANGVSGSVTNPNTTPEITITLGDITPTKVNGYTLPAGFGTNGYVLTTNGTGGTAWTSFSGSGTVTTVSVTSNNGITSSVANPTTAPAITLGLGDITPTKVNGYTLPAVDAGNAGKVLSTDATGLTSWISAGTGSVTNFSAGDLSPIFTTTEATTTTTPALTFSLNTQNDNTVLAGPTTGGPSAPTFRTLTDSDIPNNLTLSGSDLSGATFGTSPNHTTLGADGVIVHNGSATVWDDLRIQILTRTAGTPPTFTMGFAGNASLGTYTFRHDQDNSVYFEVQMPHSWKEGSKIFPHVHWSPSTTDIGKVRWVLEYTWVNVNGTFGTLQSLILDGDISSNSQWKNLIGSNTSGLTPVVGKNDKISSMMVCRLYRAGNSDAADTYPAPACLIAFDIHFEKDTEGSREEYLKDSPP